CAPSSADPPKPTAAGTSLASSGHEGNQDTSGRRSAPRRDSAARGRPAPSGGNVRGRRRFRPRGGHRGDPGCRHHPGVQPASQRPLLPRRPGDPRRDGGLPGPRPRAAARTGPVLRRRRLRVLRRHRRPRRRRHHQRLQPAGERPVLPEPQHHPRRDGGVPHPGVPVRRHRRRPLRRRRRLDLRARDRRPGGGRSHPRVQPTRQRPPLSPRRCHPRPDGRLPGPSPRTRPRRGAAAPGPPSPPPREVTRGQMASFLARAEGLATEEVPPRPDVHLRLLGEFTQPTYAIAPLGDDRIFVVEKGGRIRVYADGRGLARPFLDISDRVVNSGEMGLLSMAFHPDWPADDRVFVYYSTRDADGGLQSQVSSFRLSSDPDVLAPDETKILTIAQPATNHNGGHLLFDPNGYLLIAMGDGGGANDRFGNAQNRDSLLGKLLRIDVGSARPYAIPGDNPFLNGPGRDEIWALGLRNPWRIWIDDGLLYVADVGQGAREEINVVAADRPLVNYGWPRFEGSRCNPDAADP